MATLKPGDQTVRNRKMEKKKKRSWNTLVHIRNKSKLNVFDFICRVRHKHSQTRHGEWKFHLASTTWKSLAKLASMKLGCKYFGEYEIKVTRQIRQFTHTLITYFVLNLHKCKFKFSPDIYKYINVGRKFCLHLRRSLYKTKSFCIALYIKISENILFIHAVEKLT